MANSGPTLVLDVGRETGWDVELILKHYLAARPGSSHRARRVAWIREHLLSD